LFSFEDNSLYLSGGSFPLKSVGDMLKFLIVLIQKRVVYEDIQPTQMHD